MTRPYTRGVGSFPSVLRNARPNATQSSKFHITAIGDI